MIQSLLRKIGIWTRPPDMGPDDQTYSEAAMDNAIVDSGRTIVELSQAAALGGRVNDMLRVGIDRLKISGADPVEVVARAARHHAHR
jgi:hypothetical protein